MINPICFHCGKAVDKDDRRMYGLDVPYKNLFFHKSCFKKVGDYGNIVEYLTQRVEMVYNYSITGLKGRKIDKNGRKTQTVKSPDEKSGTVQVAY